MNTDARGFATPEVERVIARDDLLTMAAAADEAVSLVGNLPSLARLTKDDPSLFVIALKRYLESARNSRQWSARTHAWDSAAVIVRFGEMVGMRPDCKLSPEQMHANALAENAPKAGSRLDRDLAVGVFNRYHAARSLRIVGEFERALPLVMREDTDLYGTGAEPHMAHYLFERGANMLAQGQGGQVDDALREWDDYWQRTRAKGYCTRYRFDFIRALAYWDSDEHDPQEALAQLDQALCRLTTGAPVPIVTADLGLRRSADDQGVRELSVTLTKAEFLAASATTTPEREAAVRLGREALKIGNAVRGRMRVIARSRAPLAAAFRRLYGDIALLADRLARADTPGAGELGLEVALTAKQTGFAARMRADRALMNVFLRGKLDEIVQLENEPDNDSRSTRTPEQRAERLDELHLLLGDKVSSMLAETVLPSEVDLDDVKRTLGPRSALDYLELPHTLDERPHLYRSLIRPGRPVLFEQFEAAPGVAEFFAVHRVSRDLFRGLSRDARVHSSEAEHTPRPGWRSIATVLPEALCTDLRATPETALVVSGHSWLSLVPWAALPVDEDGTRLVERALVTQTPVLTCLTAETAKTAKTAKTVDGSALVRLVGAPGAGVNVASERTAWSLPANTDDVPLSTAPVCSDAAPEPHASPRLSDALHPGADWAFLHIASHGGPGIDDEASGEYDGLRQVLHIPEQRLTAARALGLRWPSAVLMASCHVGQVVNARDAEPLNFVMAQLSGGARCVVAGIAAIGDRETGTLAHHMVGLLRKGGTTLAAALRSAQLAAVEDGMDEAGWALLCAYVR